ncbi:MAG TPA: enoyl-CoA hydratase-related protein [Xanthobacteraceae bacterium]|nr:enoyl-CoA hydratase-related protein [Xanthobacteraceae bacterium]
MAVELTYRDGCAVLTLNRPEALNALSFAILGDIRDAFDEVAQSKARALIVTGAGPKAFCVGADIKELGDRDLVAQKRGAEFGQAVFARLDTLPIASIAVINGYAFGGGLELALACTFRLATPNAKLAFPEIKLGLIPGYGGTQRLPRVVGEVRALEMIMTGRTVEAEEAAQIGLISRIVEGEPVEAGVAFAKTFTCYGLPALGFARAAVQRALAVPLHEGLKIEADLSTLAFRTADAAEGIAAFTEKRPARFRDG